MLVCRLATASGVLLAVASSLALSSSASLTLSACVYYDEDDRCGPNMKFNADAHICVCDSRSIKVAGACERCPSGRTPVADKCACPSGTKENDEGECAPISGLGDACDAERPCNDDVYDYCAMRSGEDAGTCTKRCAADVDCDDAFTCADWEDMPYCRQFTTVGTACTMPGPSDPVCDGDANYCFMGMCFVTECTVSEGHATDDCPRGRKCCDVTALKLPGAKSACVALESTVCP